MIRPHLLALALALAALPAAAQTTVTDAWVRGTVPQQKATGAFMQITSVSGGKLLSAASPAAGIVEIHEMRMEGTTMKMNAVPSLELPAGKPVTLAPGGYHVMLMDLKAPLKDGDSLPLTLVVEGPGGKRETIAVKAVVRPLSSTAPAHKH